MIPRYPGLKVIKPVTYVVFRSRETGVRAAPVAADRTECRTGDSSAGAPSLPGVAREDVRLLSQDIRFIKVANAALLARR